MESFGAGEDPIFLFSSSVTMTSGPQFQWFVLDPGTPDQVVLGLGVLSVDDRLFDGFRLTLPRFRYRRGKGVGGLRGVAEGE